MEPFCSSAIEPTLEMVSQKAKALLPMSDQGFFPVQRYAEGRL